MQSTKNQQKEIPLWSCGAICDATAVINRFFVGFRCARALIALRSRSSIVEGFWPISYSVVIFVFWRSTK